MRGCDMAMHALSEFLEVPLLASFPASTNRLKLVPRDRRLADVEASHADLAKALGARVPESWPPRFVAAQGEGKGLPWRNYYLIFGGDADDPVLAGLAGVAPWPDEKRVVQFG